MGIVRVACCNGPSTPEPWARITSGLSATSSAAFLRISSTLAVAQCVSIWENRVARVIPNQHWCRSAPVSAAPYIQVPTLHDRLAAMTKWNTAMPDVPRATYRLAALS